MKPAAKFFTVLAVLNLLLFVSGASAQQNEMGGHHPCAEDVKKFCSGVQPGEGRIRACLEQNFNDLSPMCKKRIARREQRRQQQPQPPQ